MKKLLSILALILVLAIGAACAENAHLTPDTTFRDGVKFGMTQEEVKAIEKEPLSAQSFGENQNTHVTILTTGTVKLDGHDATIQYLFWNGKMYTVMYSFNNEEFYNELVKNYTNKLGAPTITDASGTANFAESVSGNRPTMIGNQYRWAWDNNVSVTLAQCSASYVAIFMDANV